MRKNYLNITIWKTISMLEFTMKIKYLKTDGSANVLRAIWDRHVKDLFAKIIPVIMEVLALSFLEVATSASVRWESMVIIASIVSLHKCDSMNISEIQFISFQILKSISPHFQEASTGCHPTFLIQFRFHLNQLSISVLKLLQLRLRRFLF